MSNHQSMVDILAVHATRLSFLWVSKVTNFYVPFLGWNMWLNRHVPLKRGYLPSILRMVRTCERRLREGDSLFVFPEGTRSPDATLQAFHRGAFWLAVRNQVPVVPIVIEGTAQILPKRSCWIAPGPVHVRILEPVHPEAVDNGSRRLQQVVHARMLATQRQLRAAPESPTAATTPPTAENLG